MLNNLLIPVTLEAKIFYIVPSLTLLTVRNIGMRLSIAEMFFMMTLGDSKVAREHAS
jgi:hypothetical protein